MNPAIYPSKCASVSKTRRYPLSVINHYNLTIYGRVQYITTQISLTKLKIYLYSLTNRCYVYECR